MLYEDIYHPNLVNKALYPFIFELLWFLLHTFIFTVISNNYHYIFLQVSHA